MGVKATPSAGLRSQQGGEQPNPQQLMAMGVRTLVLAVVHPVLGGVVVLSQAPALGGV